MAPRKWPQMVLRCCWGCYHHGACCYAPKSPLSHSWSRSWDDARARSCLGALALLYWSLPFSFSWFLSRSHGVLSTTIVSVRPLSESRAGWILPCQRLRDACMMLGIPCDVMCDGMKLLSWPVLAVLSGPWCVCTAAYWNRAFEVSSKGVLAFYICDSILLSILLTI